MLFNTVALLGAFLLPLALAGPITYPASQRRAPQLGAIGKFFGIGGEDEAAVQAASITALSAEDVISQLQRPAFFARSAYCESAALQAWTCGAPCQATPGVEVLLTGGDGVYGLVPVYFIAFDPDTQSIVVSHQGTSRSSILSIANNLQIAQVDLDPIRFPGSGSGVKVHDGFQKTFARTADEILKTVTESLELKGVNKVLVTGHSLGGAVASLDAMMLRANLDPSVEITATVFAMPRVGNQAWADLTDKMLGASFTHVTNQNDVVPTIPPTFLDYVHAGGEVFITPGTDTVATSNGLVRCAGQENEGCIVGQSLLDISISNHNGPYFNGISFGSSACPDVPAI